MLKTNVEVSYEIWRWLAQLFLRRRLKSFPCMSLRKTSDLLCGAILDPRSIIWKLFVKVHKIKLHTKYQKPSSYRQEDVQRFA